MERLFVDNPISLKLDGKVLFFKLLGIDMDFQKCLFFLLFLLPIASQAQQYAPQQQQQQQYAPQQQQQQQQPTGGCSNYPFVAGATDVQMTDLGVKILSTGAASVDFDEPDEVQDAITEATLEAKVVIAKFFNEDIKNDQSIETLSKKATNMTRDASGTQKTATKNKIKTTLKKISSNSAAMLRGVVTLSQCYDKGSQVLVTVGL